VKLLGYIGILTACAGCSTVDRPEQLRTLHRRIQEIDGEIVNSCQILIYCSVNGEDGDARNRATAGVLEILGPPDNQEKAYALSLTAETVEPVIVHGIALGNKRTELLKNYTTAEEKLSHDFAHLSRSSSLTATIKWLTISTMSIFFLLRLLP
jgi:hypothetical protein